MTVTDGISIDTIASHVHEQGMLFVGGVRVVQKEIRSA